jgi:hypothetical protein
MILSQKRKQNIKKRNSYRNRKRVMKGRGNIYDPKLDAALTYLNIYSRSLIESNDNLVDYIDECMADLLPIYNSNNMDKALNDVQNYLKGKVSELKSRMFNSNLEADYLCKELKLDSNSCVTALASLCIYNLVEGELRHMAFEPQKGGSPFTIRKRLRRVAQGAAAATAGWVSAAAVVGGATCSAGGVVCSAAGVCTVASVGAGACVVAMAPAVAIGAGAAYSAYHASYHLVNGLYVAGCAAYRGAYGAVAEFSHGIADHFAMRGNVPYLPDPLNENDQHALDANARNPVVHTPAWVRNVGNRLVGMAPHPVQHVDNTRVQRVRQFVQMFPNANEEIATNFLNASGWNLEQAVTNYMAQ